MKLLLRSILLLRLPAALVFPLLLTVGVACNAPAVGSPYIPIPPPPNPTFGSPTSEIDSAGVTHVYWKVTSPPSSGLSALFVYLTNLDMGSGTITRAAQDGSYEARLEGQQDDWILLTFGAPDGQSMCRPLREGLAAVSCQ